MPADITLLKKRYASLQADRSNWEGQWQDIAMVMSPRKSDFQSKTTPGTKRMQRIYDSTGLHGVELMAAGLNSIATNPATEWFGCRMVRQALNERDDVREYCQAVVREIRNQMYAPNTGFETALDECYQEVAAFGNTALFIGEKDAGGFLFQPRSLTETYFAENGEGIVDTVFRKTVMTARNIMATWPKTASDKVRRVAEKNPDNQFEICHAVYPRKDRDYSRKDQINMPYVSCYFETEGSKSSGKDAFLEEGGFPEFPFAVLRWRKKPGEVYAWSQGVIALPDVQMLQEMTKMLIQRMQRTGGTQPIFVPDQSVVGPLRLDPNGINFYKGQTPPFYLPYPPADPANEKLMADVRNRILTIFFADIFQIITDARMTATEAQIRTSERMRLLGPIMGRLTDFLGQIFARTFGILGRQGQLPQAPPALQGQELTVQFTSPIANAQKAAEAQMPGQALTALSPFMMGDPSGQTAQAIMAQFEISKLVKFVADKIGLPDELVKDAEVVEAEAAQKQMQQSMQQMIPTAIEGMSKGAKAVDNLASAQEKGADIKGLMERMQGGRQAA